MTRIALGLQYDGRPWHGWQSQPHGRTVQDALESALSTFADMPIRTACAGRTDTGVHALGQVAHFDCAATRTIEGWVRGVNALLPESIAVSWARAMVDPAEDRRADERADPSADPGANRDTHRDPGRTFDARFDAMARTYHYLLLVQPHRAPHWVGRAGWIHTPLDLDAMRGAARALLGTHDFSSFRSAECQAKSPVKTMHAADVEASGPFVRFTFRADAFLHHMVRNLVGALVAIGRGREPQSWMTTLLGLRDRTRSAPTFMPDGLYLARVDYPARLAVPAPVPFTLVHAGFAAERSNDGT
jgi:tRNA pseudouridine38-40 synthase